MGAEYDDCPQECIRDNRHRRYEPYRAVLCKTCPRNIKRREFARATVREWEKWFDARLLRFLDFEKAYDLLNKLLLIRELPKDELSYTANVYIGVFETEELRSRR